MTRCITVVLLFNAIAAMIVGCATTPAGQGVAYVRPSSIPSDKALVYVYRDYAEPLVWSATVVLGNREVASLSQRTFTWFFANPGINVVRANWPALSGQIPSTIELEMKPGSTYYLELTGVSRVAGVTPSGTGIAYTFRMGSGMNERPPELAESTILTCCTHVRATAIE
jgi:hypothetical protein